MFALAAGPRPHLKQLNVHKTSITEVSRRQLAGLKLLRKGLSVLVDDEDKNCLLAREWGVFFCSGRVSFPRLRC